MNAKTLEAIRKHGEQLLAIFPNANERDPVALCKKLRRVETAASRWNVECCNWRDPSEDEQEANDAKICSRVAWILGTTEGFIYNKDPRGYALKIDDAVMRANDYQLHRDWGGYGIIAPDLTEAHNPTRKAR